MPSRLWCVALFAIISVAAAAPHKDVFVTLGLGDSFLEDLGQSVTDFDQATDDSHTGRRDHVGARAELDVVAEDCVKLTRLLDGLYRIRFRNDAESLAAWQSSKNVAGPFRGKPQDPAAPVPLPIPLPGPVASGGDSPTAGTA